MSVTIKGVSGAAYIFEGPFENLDYLEEESGMYAVLCVRVNKFDLVDVGESSHVRTCVENHDRRECWKQSCFGVLKYAVRYDDYDRKHARNDVVKDIAANYYLICGG